MAFDPGPIMHELETQLSASGWQTGQIAEPMSPPAERLGAVIFDGVEITEATLGKGSGNVRFIIRLYYKHFEEPLEGTEKDIATACLQLISDISGKYTLGDNSVRNVVPLAMNVRAGFQTVGQTTYRLADLSVHVLVNDIATWAA